MPAAPGADASMDRAAAAFSAGRLDESWDLCQAILHEAPAHFFALHLASVVAARRAQWLQAVELATRALHARPGHPEVLGNRGAALRMLRRYEEAIADYDAALVSAPDSAEVRNNRGIALAAMQRHDDALAEYARALATAPAFAEAHYNRGISLATLNRHAEAIEAYSRALEIEPAHARARWNRGLSRLATGHFREGFADYEARHLLGDARAGIRPVAGKAWDGRDSIAGKTVLVRAEQGLGDCIQFSRFARTLRDRGARVLLEAPAALAPLLASLPYLADVIPSGSFLPPFDLHCAIASLPGLLGTRVEDIPLQDPPIAPPPEWLDRWRRRLADVKGPLVGIAWAGGTGLHNDDPRSIALARWRGVRELPVTFVALQKEIPAADREALASPKPLLHFEDAIEDFRDTAALLALVDLVVTIDTSVAHLAAAMGRPTWILLPFAADWRWLLARDDSPWYPTARLLRQPRPGDWDPVLDRVAHDLRARIALPGT